VLWIVRTGTPWRDLPAFFGNWNTVFKRYRDWVKADVFVRLFDAYPTLAGRPDVLGDRTSIRGVAAEK
jgi:transposase